MTGLAFDALFSFSTVPLRLAGQAGVVAILFSLLYLLFVLVSLALHKPVVPGWTSIIFVLIFLGGVQLASIGLLGEYVARIFEEAKRRPLYLLKQQPAPEILETKPRPRDDETAGRIKDLPRL
jgi:dolichol-phosphate mannosyltransferase